MGFRKTLAGILLAASLFGGCEVSSNDKPGASTGTDVGDENPNPTSQTGAITGRVTFPFVEGYQLVYRGLTNAKIEVLGTDLEILTANNGDYSLGNVPTGNPTIKASCSILDDCIPYEGESYPSYTAAIPEEKTVIIFENETTDVPDFELMPFMIRDKIIQGKIFLSPLSNLGYYGPINLYLPNELCSGSITRSDCSPSTLLETSYTSPLGAYAFRFETDRRIACLSTSITSPQNKIHFFESDDECTYGLSDEEVFIFERDAYIVP